MQHMWQHDISILTYDFCITQRVAANARARCNSEEETASHRGHPEIQRVHPAAAVTRHGHMESAHVVRTEREKGVVICLMMNGEVGSERRTDQHAAERERVHMLQKRVDTHREGSGRGNTHTLFQTCAGWTSPVRSDMFKLHWKMGLYELRQGGSNTAHPLFRFPPILSSSWWVCVSVRLCNTPPYSFF